MGQRSLKHDIMDTYFQTFPLVLLRERSGNSTCKACKSSIEWGIDPFLFDAYLGLNGRLVLLNLLSNSPSRRQCNPCLLMFTDPSISLFHHVPQFSFLQRRT
jgi:hypothetical protein